MSKIIEREVFRSIGGDGKIILEGASETVRDLKKYDEPDYIKIYTNTFCEFTGVPSMYRDLFMQLVVRMSYANSNNPEYSQTVATTGPNKEAIKKALNWKDDMFRKGLSQLAKRGLIKRIALGWYQINPAYAGKGKWLYDSRLDQGGISKLVATFDFVKNKVDTEIEWVQEPSNVQEVDTEWLEKRVIEMNSEKSNSEQLSPEINTLMDEIYEIDEILENKTKECLFCKKTYESNNHRKKYCSDSCRKKYSYEKKKAEDKEIQMKLKRKEHIQNLIDKLSLDEEINTEKTETAAR